MISDRCFAQMSGALRDKLGGSWTVWYAKSTFNSVPRAVLTRDVLGGTNKQIVQYSW